MSKTIGLDYHFALLMKANTVQQKIKFGRDLLEYLQNGASFECQDIGAVVGGILPFIQSSNVKVSHMGMDVMTELVRRTEHAYRPYIPSVLPSVIDRLGDSKETVREGCHSFLTSLVNVGLMTPQQLIDQLAPAFSNCCSDVKDGVMKCLVAILDRYGGNCIELSQIVPLVAKLLADPNVDVKNQGLSTILQVYQHVGDGLRPELAKCLPPSEIPVVMKELDKIKLANDFSLAAMDSVGGVSIVDECLISDASTVNASDASSRCVPSDEPSALVDIRASDKRASALNWSKASPGSSFSQSIGRGSKSVRKSVVKSFRCPVPFKRNMKRDISVDISLTSDSSSEGLTGCNMELTLAPVRAEPIFKSRSKKRRSIDFHCGDESSVISGQSSNDGSMMLDMDRSKNFVNIFKKKNLAEKNIDFSLPISADSSSASEHSLPNNPDQPDSSTGFPNESVSKSMSLQDANMKSRNCTFTVEASYPDVQHPALPSNKVELVGNRDNLQPSTVVGQSTYVEKSHSDSISNLGNGSLHHFKPGAEVSATVKHVACDSTIVEDIVEMPPVEQVSELSDQGNQNASLDKSLSINNGSLNTSGNVNGYADSIQTMDALNPGSGDPDKTPSTLSSAGVNDLPKSLNLDKSLTEKSKDLPSKDSHSMDAEEQHDVDPKPITTFWENGFETCRGNAQTEEVYLAANVQASSQSLMENPREEKSDCLEICSTNTHSISNSENVCMSQLNPGTVALVKAATAQQAKRDISVDISLTSDSSSEGLTGCNMELTLAPALAEPIFKSRSTKRCSIAFPCGDDSSVVSGHSTNGETLVLDVDQTKSYVNLFKKRKLNEKGIDISLQFSQSTDSSCASEQISSTRGSIAGVIPESLTITNANPKSRNATFTVEEISHKSIAVLDTSCIDVQPLDLPAKTNEFHENGSSVPSPRLEVAGDDPNAGEVDLKMEHLEVGSAIEKPRTGSSAILGNCSPSHSNPSAIADVATTGDPVGSEDTMNVQPMDQLSLFPDHLDQIDSSDGKALLKEGETPCKIINASPGFIAVPIIATDALMPMEPNQFTDVLARSPVPTAAAKISTTACLNQTSKDSPSQSLLEDDEELSDINRSQANNVEPIRTNAQNVEISDAESIPEGLRQTHVTHPLPEIIVAPPQPDHKFITFGEPPNEDVAEHSSTPQAEITDTSCMQMSTELCVRGGAQICEAVPEICCSRTPSPNGIMLPHEKATGYLDVSFMPPLLASQSYENPPHVEKLDHLEKSPLVEKPPALKNSGTCSSPCFNSGINAEVAGEQLASSRAINDSVDVIGTPPVKEALQLPQEEIKKGSLDGKVSIEEGQNPHPPINSAAMHDELKTGSEVHASEVRRVSKSASRRLSAKVDDISQAESCEKAVRTTYVNAQPDKIEMAAATPEPIVQNPVANTQVELPIAPRASTRKFVTFRESSPEVLNYSAGSEPSSDTNAAGNEATRMQMTTDLSMIPGDKIRKTRSGGCYSSTPFPKKKMPTHEKVTDDHHVFLVPCIPASQNPQPSEGSASSTINSDYTLNLSAIPKDAALPKSTKLFTSTPKPPSKPRKNRSAKGENAVNHSVQTSRVLRSSSRSTSGQEINETRSSRAITDVTNLTSYGDARGKEKKDRSKSQTDIQLVASKNHEPSVSPVEPIPIVDETVLCPQVRSDSRAVTSSHNVRTVTSKGSLSSVSQIDRRSASKRLFTPTSSKLTQSTNQFKSMNSLAVAGPSTNRLDLSNEDLRSPVNSVDLDHDGSIGGDEGALPYAPDDSLQGASASEADIEEFSWPQANESPQFSSRSSSCSGSTESIFDCDNALAWYRKHGTDFKTRSARNRKKTDLTVPELRKMKPIKSYGSGLESWMRKKRKMFKPAKWVTKDLYVYLEKQLEPLYGLDKRLKAEEVVLCMADSYNRVQAGHINGATDQVKAKMRELEICNTYFTFYSFLRKFMPYEYLKHVLQIPSKLYAYHTREPRHSCYDLI